MVTVRTRPMSLLRTTVNPRTAQRRHCSSCHPVLATAQEPIRIHVPLATIEHTYGTLQTKNDHDPHERERDSQLDRDASTLRVRICRRTGEDVSRVVARWVRTREKEKVRLRRKLRRNTREVKKRSLRKIRETRGMRRNIKSSSPLRDEM